MIDLYFWPTPNGHKIPIMLEECGLEYRVKSVNMLRGEQFRPSFLRVNPNNKIPAIIDTDGPGGKTVTVFESGAILLYLAEKTGKFLPADLVSRVPVYEWLMFQMGGFGPIPGQVHHFLGLTNEDDKRYGLERFSKETHRLYSVMDKRLAAHTYFAGELSIADFAILGWAWRHQRHQVDLAEYPNVKSWYELMMARPAVQRGFAVALK